MHIVYKIYMTETGSYM